MKLTKTAILRKQWTSGILSKRYSLSALLTQFTKINVQIESSAKLKMD